MISVLFLGLLMGLRHALEADHIMAVATLNANNNPSSAMKHGAVWGVGHTLTLLAIGGFFLFIDSLVPEQVAQMLEFCVGIMLLLLGIDVLRSVMKKQIHIHAHEHADGVVHVHPHAHSNESGHRYSTHDHAHLRDLPLRALFIGAMHGVAGSAALILLALQTVQSPALGALYIIIFGLGSIIGMAILSTVIALPMKYSLGKLRWFHNSVRSVVGVATLSLGAYIIYDIGIIRGLLIS
jgi:cytochrome c biogenesis protein CcdA